MGNEPTPLPKAKPTPQPLVPGAAGAPAVPGKPGAPVVAKGAALPPGVKLAAADQIPPGDQAPEEPLGPPLTFWEQPWVQNILPFATSLSVHAGILIIGLLAVGAYKIVHTQPTQEQTIIPDSNMVENGPPGGIPNVGLGSDVMRQAAQDKDPSTDTKAWADKKGPSVDPTPAGAAGDNATVFDAGAMASIGGGSGANGSGTSDGSGALAMFGTPGGGGIGPQGPVFGNGGNARLITFVCDASGSMINKMASLKDQLNKAVVGLKQSQSFNIIFFQDKTLDALDKSGNLVVATPEAKRRAGTFLEGVTTTGTTDPIPGIELAFKSHPQLIYLLTDGDFPDNDAVLKRIRELNKDKKVKINTIAFVGQADTETAFKDLLKTIATESGGTFKLVNEGDL